MEDTIKFDADFPMTGADDIMWDSVATVATDVPNASSAVMAEYWELLSAYPGALKNKLPLFSAAYAAELVVSETPENWVMAPAYAETLIP
jgi:hypothetical protein